jgi:hypothetical protein
MGIEIIGIVIGVVLVIGGGIAILVMKSKGTLTKTSGSSKKKSRI